MKIETSGLTTGSSYRFVGWMAIASGIMGLIAFGFLVSGLIPHWNIALWEEATLFRAHDAGVIVQFVLMIPGVYKLSELSSEQFLEKSPSILILGMGALVLSVLLLALNFFYITADILYMVPQGAFGMWLMIVNRRTVKTLSKGLRRLGIIAGLGLFIVGSYPILFAALVDTLIFQGPSAKGYEPPATTANIVIHLMLMFGTLMGVTTYPIWNILIGLKFHRAGLSQK
jgi:hypothetical protein